MWEESSRRSKIRIGEYAIFHIEYEIWHIKYEREVMVATEVDIGTMITSSPEIRGGRPRVAGTGMTVMRIAGWYKLGFTPEEISRKIELSLAQIYAALAYYHANREVIDADLDAEAAEYDRVSMEHKLKRAREAEEQQAA
jgi:uncharacterized protein (DUF433 family)